MYAACVQTFAQWREAARPLLLAGIAPEDVEWREHCSGGGEGTQAEVSLRTRGSRMAPKSLSLDGASSQAPASSSSLRLSRRLIDLLDALSCYRDPGRWTLMYRLAWRALKQPRLLEDAADPEVRRAMTMEAAVNRECHKMHAFVRFREADDGEGGKRYFAWFEPQHQILRAAVPFFCKRFPNMEWMIATPDGAAVWRARKLTFVPPPDKSTLPQGDGHETLWRTYYRSICNVNRLSPPAMRREMPRHYWHNLPETAEIPNLLRDGRTDFARQQQEVDYEQLARARGLQKALADLPDHSGGPSACRRCEIWRHATQAVSGEGPDDAAVMLVGEQPGDEEDLRGRPFVGPAGRVLDEALQAAGLDRARLFVTNAVKHFKWQPRGKRRLHKRADAAEIAACEHWLRQEIARIQPRVIVTLGATALRAVAGRADSIEAARRMSLTDASGAIVVCTYHPSAILRSDADQARALQLKGALVQDLQRAGSLAAEFASKPNR